MGVDSEPLTRREAQIARRVGYGLGNHGIAAALGISKETVAIHLKRIFQKLGIHSRAELARRVAGGLLEFHDGDDAP